MKLSQIKPADKAQKILIYGPPKSGKTLLLGKLAAAGYEVDLLDLDNGSITLVNHLSDEAKERINVYSIADTKEKPIGIETVSQIFRDLGKAHSICQAHGRINCPVCKKEGAEFDLLDLPNYTNKRVLAIDSFSQLSDSCMAYVASDVKGLDLNDKLSEYSRVEFKHYDAQGRILSAICSAIQAAKINIVVVTHEVDISKEDRPEALVPKAGTKNFAKVFGRYFDHVVYLEVANRKHVAYSGTTEKPTVQVGGRSEVSIHNGGGLENLLTGIAPVVQKDSPKVSTPAKPATSLSSFGKK